jgi:uncharacterized membrane protein HdeD (DUF308 family)
MGKVRPWYLTRISNIVKLESNKQKELKMNVSEIDEHGNLPAFLGDLQKNWGWVFALGIVFLILGIIGLGMTMFLTLVTVLYFGILLIIGGVIQLVRTFRTNGEGNLAFHLVMAVLYGLAGVVIIQHPKLASAFFTAVIAFVLIIQGAMRVAIGFRLREHLDSWFWPFFAGLISILLGLIILVHWPVSGLWVIGLFIAVEMIVQGWTYIMLGLAARSV